MARILLVHGSCHGAWCWRDLIPELTNLAIDAEGESPASAVVEDADIDLEEEEVTP